MFISDSDVFCIIIILVLVAMLIGVPCGIQIGEQNVYSEIIEKCKTSKVFSIEEKSFNCTLKSK